MKNTIAASNTKGKQKKLFQLANNTSGFISLANVKSIKEDGAFFLAVNLYSLVSKVKSAKYCIPVFGRIDLNYGFMIDKSNFKCSEIIDHRELKSGKTHVWVKINIDKLDHQFLDINNKNYDIEKKLVNLWNCDLFQKDDFLKEIKDFMLLDFDSLDVDALIKLRENLINRNKCLIKALESDVDEIKLQQIKIFLIDLELETLNNYLFSTYNWQALSE